MITPLCDSLAFLGGKIIITTDRDKVARVRMLRTGTALWKDITFPQSIIVREQ